MCYGGNMKLFNLNICVKIDNNIEVVDLISNDNYDIVTLQESMRRLDNNVNPVYDSCNFIREQTRYKNNFFGAMWVAKQHCKYGKVVRNFGGYVEQGNQTLTNLPIMKSRNVFYYQEYSNFEDTTDFRLNDHPRAFTEIIVKDAEKELQIINVHGTWNADKKGNDRTKIQTKAILEIVRNDIPSIVVGDFNLLPCTEEIKSLSVNMINLIEKFNIKSTRPNFDDGLDKGNIICDYIFVNDLVKVNNFYILDSNVSDHLPLILDFDI